MTAQPVRSDMDTTAQAGSYTSDGVYVGHEGTTDAFEMCMLTGDVPGIDA